jgi:hypothetical protein
MNLITRQEIEDAIFYGEMPKRTFNVLGKSFTFVINEPFKPSVIYEWVDFFETSLFITGTNTKSFLLSLPHPIFMRIIDYYNDFYKSWINGIQEHTKEISEDARSRTTWRIGEKFSFDKVIEIKDKINSAQYYWSIFNIMEDKKEQGKMVSSIFEALKPWLDKELWSNLNNTEESTKINMLYEQQIAAFEGTSDLDELVMENPDAR